MRATKQQRGYIYGLYKKKGMDLSESDKTDIENLGIEDANDLIQQLKGEKKTDRTPDQSRNAMGKKIIHLLCMAGMTGEDGRADYGRINKFISEIGSNNPRKVELWSLYTKEMLPVLNQVETLYGKETKKLKNG